MDDSEIIRLLKQTKDYSYVSSISGLSISALYTKNCRQWKIPMSIWDKAKIERLRAIFPNMTDEQVSTELGLTKKQIQYKARKLGLKKNQSHLDRIYKLTSRNISSGPCRHQFNKSHDSTIFFATGKQHPNWVSDRSKIKGPRRKQHRFSVTIMKRITILQDNRCKICNDLIFDGEYDHIVPVCIGGDTSIENCQLLCKECHYYKSRNDQTISNNYLDLEKLQEAYSFFARNLI